MLFIILFILSLIFQCSEDVQKQSIMWWKMHISAAFSCFVIGRELCEHLARRHRRKIERAKHRRKEKRAKKRNRKKKS